MPANMIADVFLSHIVNQSDKDLVAKISRFLGLSIISILPLWLALSLLTPLAVKLLYPQYLYQIEDILTWVNIGFALRIAEIFVRPMVIRFVPIRKMALLYSGNVAAYVAGGYIAALNWGLLGFSIGFAVLAGIKFIFVCLVLFLASQNGDRVA